MERDEFKQYGFPYSENLSMAFIGGSQLHGAKLQGSDDTDWYGVFIEPLEKSLGIDAYEHFVYTTGDQRGRNKPNDVDVCLYSLSKWARLATKGNPSVLHFLFAKPEWQNAYWGRIYIKSDLFVAKSHIGAFLGYGNAQLRRLLNQRAKDVNRPFLEEQHGYDTKYAMHIVRLMHEAKELMADGKITLPRPEKELLMDVRKGKYKLYELEQLINDKQSEALAAKETSPLQDTVDRKTISELVSKIYLDYYNSST